MELRAKANRTVDESKELSNLQSQNEFIKFTIVCKKSDC